jgi:hypothetical protein
MLAECERESARNAEALRAGHARTARLERELAVAEQGRQRDRAELARMRSELELHRSHYDEQMRGLATLGARLDELAVTARGQATRIRLRALREAAELSVRSEELRKAGEGADERLIAAVEAAIARVGTQWEEEDDPAPHPGGSPIGREVAPSASGSNGAAPEAALAGEGSRVEGNSSAPAPAGGDPVGPPPPADPEGAGRRVSVDVGPFDDFSQLVRFEDAANAIGAAGEITIRRFSGGRATVDVALDEPVDLLRELEERCDLEFRVRHNGGDEIVLDVNE